MKPVNRRSVLGLNCPDEAPWTPCSWCGTSCGRPTGFPTALPDAVFPRQTSLRPSRFASTYLSEQRLTEPQKRSCSGDLHPVPWDLAFREFTGRFKEIQWRHGPKSVVVVVPGQLPIEELAFARDLVHNGMGARWGGMCLGEGLTQTRLHFDDQQGNQTPLCQPDDFRTADAIILIGAPSFRPHTQRYGIRPDVIEIHAQAGNGTEEPPEGSLCVSPGGEGLLLRGLARTLMELCLGGDPFSLSALPLEWRELALEFRDDELPHIAAQLGIQESQIRQLARRIFQARQTSIWWQLDGRQNVPPAWTLDALTLVRVCRLIGQPDSRANVALAPCGVLGAHLVEEVTPRFPLGPQRHQATLGNGPTWETIREEIENGEIQGLWVIGTNSVSDASEFLPRSILKHLEFLVVQRDSVSCPFVEEADLCFPSAGWGEKSGTIILPSGLGVTNDPTRTPPGAALTDFQIFRQVANYWGCGARYEHWETCDGLLKHLVQAAGKAGWQLEFSENPAVMRGRQF